MRIKPRVVSGGDAPVLDTSGLCGDLPFLFGSILGDVSIGLKVVSQ